MLAALLTVANPLVLMGPLFKSTPVPQAVFNGPPVPREELWVEFAVNVPSVQFTDLN